MLLFCQHSVRSSMEDFWSKSSCTGPIDCPTSSSNTCFVHKLRMSLAKRTSLVSEAKNVVSWFSRGHGIGCLPTSVEWKTFDMSPLQLESGWKSISSSRNKFHPRGLTHDGASGIRTLNSPRARRSLSHLDYRVKGVSGAGSRTNVIPLWMDNFTSFQIELETLNTATDEINKLEIELEASTELQQQRWLVA